jgi:hypothetical protein
MFHVAMEKVPLSSVRDEAPVCTTALACTMINVTATPPALPELHEGSDQTATTYPILVDERVGVQTKG